MKTQETSVVHRNRLGFVYSTCSLCEQDAPCALLPVVVNRNVKISSIDVCSPCLREVASMVNAVQEPAKQ